MDWVLWILRTVWTGPTTMLGVVVGLVATPFGTRWRVRQGTLECFGGPVAWLLAHATLLEEGALAMTLGDVILGQSPAALDLCREHEQVHVRQAHRWGPLFVPAYLGASVWALVRGRSGYRGNAFEEEAYRVCDARRRGGRGR